MTGELHCVAFDCIAGMRFDLTQQISGQLNIKVLNPAGFAAGEMAVGVATVAIQPTAGSIQALDHPSRLEGFKVLVYRCMPYVTSKIVEAFKNIPGTEMALFNPKQIQHHAPLPAQPHPQIATMTINIFHIYWRACQSKNRGNILRRNRQASCISSICAA